MNENNWFDDYGNFIGEIPTEAVEDCTAPGRSADSHCRMWVEELGFNAPRIMAVDYAVEFGAWTRDELGAMTQEELNDLIFWLACCDISEGIDSEGEDYPGWIGLIH